MQNPKKWLNQLKNFFNKRFWEYYLASFCWWISSSCENHCTLVSTYFFWKMASKLNSNLEYLLQPELPSRDRISCLFLSISYWKHSTQSSGFIGDTWLSVLTDRHTANKFGIMYSRIRISQNSFPNFNYIFSKSFMIFCQELQDPKRNYENQI